MLDAFIIEEIKRRERIREDRDHPVVELPLPTEDEAPRRRSEEKDERPSRGVVIIDLAL